MAINNKKQAIVFCATKNMVFAIASVIQDLHNTNSAFAVEYVILHDGISKRDRENLLKLARIKFIKYVFPIKDLSAFHAGTLQYFTKMVYAKLECFKLLDEYKTIIFTDYDVIIRKDISELFNIIEPFSILISKGSTVRDQFSADIPGFDMHGTGVSTGLFVLNDTLSKSNEIYAWCYNKVIEYAPHLRYPDQGIIALAIQEFGLKPRNIDQHIYCIHPDEISSFPDAKILHAYGKLKFWNGLYNEQWQANYKKWLAMGGSKYKENELKKLVFRLKRKINSILSRSPMRNKK